MPEDKDSTSGVYAIRCIPTNRVYVGSAVSLNRRWRKHQHELRTGKHHSRFLQRAWNKHGEDAFRFSVLEHVVRDHLIAREQHWIDVLEACNPRRGFNLCPVAGSCLGVRHTAEVCRANSERMKGRIFSEEHRSNLSASGRRKGPVSEETRAKHRGKTPTPEVREKIRNAALGRKITPETRAKMSAAHKGIVHPPEVIERIAAKQRGKVIPPDQRAKMSAAHKGRKHAPEVVARIAEMNRGQKRSEESRKRMSVAAKARWVRRREKREGTRKLRQLLLFD